MLSSGGKGGGFQVERRIDLGHILTIITIIVAATVFIVRIEKDVNETKTRLENVDEKQDTHIEGYKMFRYEEVPSVYMRQDVIGPQLETIKQQLERIENKVNE